MVVKDAVVAVAPHGAVRAKEADAKVDSPHNTTWQGAPKVVEPTDAMEGVDSNYAEDAVASVVADHRPEALLNDNAEGELSHNLVARYSHKDLCYHLVMTRLHVHGLPCLPSFADHSTPRERLESN